MLITKPPHQFVMPVVREVLGDRRAPADPPGATAGQRRPASGAVVRRPAWRA